MIRKDFNSLLIKPFEFFNKDWALLTAGNLNDRNTMTISWGTIGTLWNKNVVFVFVRKSRFTYHLMENSERFTLSFLDSKYREQLIEMGRLSGKDIDKYKKTGLTPIYDTDSTVSYIKESKMVFKCKKLYHFDIDKEHFDSLEIFMNQYSEFDFNDFHRCYIAEVTQVLVKEDED